MPIETPTMENLTTLEGKYGDEGDKLLFRVLNSGNPFADLSKNELEALFNVVSNSEEMQKMVMKSIMVAGLENAKRIYNAEFSNELLKIAKKATEKGLRYDLTVPFARYVVMNKNEITFPFKRYQMQPVWRADRPQKGRYREFWQCDADVVGSDSLLNEVDLIQIYLEAFELLKIPVQVKYNNRKLLDGLSHILGLSDKLVEMTIILDKQDKIGLDAVVNELKELGADPIELHHFLDALRLPFDAVKVDSFFDKNEISKKGMDELKTVSKGINISLQGQEEFKSRIFHDLALARGLSYYTGAIFEVVVTDERCSLKSSIGGGGRYDNLTGIFGLPNVSGVGISFGLDRIYDVMDELNLFPHGLNKTSTQVLICAFDEPTQMSALAILKKLRDTQIASELYPELPQSKKDKENPLQKPMNYADALHIPFRLIIKQDSMLLKDIKGVVIPVSTVEDIINQIK
jgi:histidyl-tRNA synthetase